MYGPAWGLKTPTYNEGINSRLDGLQASILSANLHLPDWTNKRIQHAATHHMHLGIKGIQRLLSGQALNIPGIYM
jgi:hypothetical protein